MEWYSVWLVVNQSGLSRPRRENPQQCHDAADRQSLARASPQPHTDARANHVPAALTSPQAPQNQG
eukprot:515243-Amphidinium_carterae.2